MRVVIENLSARPDEIVFALAEYAATFFPHVVGHVPVIIKNCKTGCRSHGMCYGRRRCVIWIARPQDCETMKWPKKFEEMHYFQHANHDDVKTLVMNDWKEELLGIIAHEMEHTTRGNKQMRRSRQEIHAWNREVEVLDASRTDAGKAFIEKAINDMVERQKNQQNRQLFKKSPEFKLQQLDLLRQKWQRKMKLAQTKIRKLNTRIKYFERKQAACKSAGGES